MRHKLGWALMLGMALLASGRAAAAEEWLTHGTGFSVGPVRGAPDRLQPLAVDPRGHLLLLPVHDVTYNTPASPIECWDASVSPARKVNVLADYTGQPHWVRLGMGHSGRSDFLLQVVPPPVDGTRHISYFRGGCGVAGTSLGTLEVGDGPLAPSFLWRPVLPVLSSGDLVYPAQGGLARVSFSGGAPAGSLLATRAALEEALGPSGLKGEDGSPRQVQDTVWSLTATPDDHVWLVVERLSTVPNTSSTTRYLWVLAVDTAGRVAVRHGPDATVTQLVSPSTPYLDFVYDASLDALLLSSPTVRVGPHHGTRASLGVLPRRAGARLLWQAALEFPITTERRTWDGLHPSPSGGVWLAQRVETTRELRMRPLVFQRAAGDLDRDGLRASEEDARGMLDTVADSDGDGFGDGAEVSLHGTDPLSAASAPSVSAQGRDVTLAPSLLPTSWPLRGFSGGPAGGRVLCDSTRCVGPTGAPLAVTPVPNLPGLPTRLTPDGMHAFYYSDGRKEWVRRELATQVERPVSASQGLEALDFLALSADVVLFTEAKVGAPARRLWRYGPGTSFAVIDTLRPACPILGGPEELHRCDTPEAAWPGLVDFRASGWDAARKLALVVVQTHNGQVLLGVDEKRVVFLADLDAFREGLDVAGIFSLPGGGYVAHLGSARAGVNLLATVRLDENFQPIPGVQNPLAVGDVSRFGSFFQSGFVGEAFEVFLIERGPTGGAVCSEFPGGFICDIDNNPYPQLYKTHDYAAEWVPVTPALGRGEVLFWAPRKHRAPNATPVRERDGTYGPGAGTGWWLWRMTPVGAVDVWLDARDFEARLDAAGKASVAQRPLGPITAMGAARDSLRVCLVEAAAGRLWEVKLHAATRYLESITLHTPSGGVSACAYDDADALALLTAAPVVLRAGGREVPLSGVSQPRSLLRFPGRWVVTSEFDTARCVDDSGALFDTNLKVLAASEAMGGVLAYLDGSARGFLSPPGDFCTGAPPLERLDNPNRNVLLDLYVMFTFRPVTAPRASMVVRPDGVVVVGAAAVDFGLGQNSEMAYAALFHYFPTYRPLDWSKRVTAADPFRASEAKGFLAARLPMRTESMVMIPGAPASTHWGHLLRPAPLQPPAVDPGPGGGGEEPPQVAPPTSCLGCSSGPGATGLLTLLAWALCVRRRAR